MKTLKAITELFETIIFFLTDKYEIFHTLEFNRPVIKSHVKVIEESIKKWGFKGAIQVIKTDVIDGIMRYYILDGQHRLAACRRLNVKVAFQVTHLETKHKVVQFISDLNTSSKGWGTSQFLKVWGGLSIPEYLKLRDVYNKTGFQITPLIEAYTFNGVMTDFRSGDLKFPNEKASDLLIEQLIELNQYLPSKAFCRRTILRLMQQDSYNHKKVMRLMPIFISSLEAQEFSENEKQLRSEFQRLINAKDLVIA